jgi:autoinducer 2 (AI-2) kinase
VAGWSAPVQLVLDRPLLDPKRRTWTGLHVLRDRWVLESNAGDTGRAWEWVCSMLDATPAEADALASQSPPGAHDGLMVLGRAPMNAAQMTAGVGAITFPLPLAMWSLDRADLLRATLEAAAYAIRANIEQLEEVSGRRIERLKLAGGMSRSALFAQILADVLDRPIEVARSPETTALGAAALAFVATGTYGSIDEAVAAMTEPRNVVTPDLRTSATYDDCYARWRMLAQHMEQAP